MALEAKFEACLKRLGWPPRKRYQAAIGGLTTNTEVIEREWEGFAAMEAALAKALADAEQQALGKESESLIEASQNEVYWVL
jgi:hypothetical protein